MYTVESVSDPAEVIEAGLKVTVVAEEDIVDRDVEIVEELVYFVKEEVDVPELALEL